ncbi:MAG: protein kinase, partial [Myxococcota bacterium]
MLNYCPNCMATIMDNTAAQCTTCGGTGLPGGVWPQDQWLGEEVDGGRYTVTRLLGRGGFGQVYEVHHTLVEGRVLAMKMLNEIASGDPTREQEFLNEIKILMTLEHPHVVKCYEAGRLGDGALFVLMEKIDGQELGSVVYEPDHLYSPEQTIRMGLQIASALGAAHGQGLLHRDLKPANILVLDSGDIRVVDFGIAKILGPEPKGQLSQVIGTPLYMAPEQFTKGADVDGRLDIYQLGAVLHFALTGQPPYPLGSALSGIVQLISAQQSRVGRPGPSPSEVRPRLSDQAPMLDALVADMLSTDIHMRPESTQVVEQRLQQCLAALTQRPSQASVPTQPDVAVPKPWPDTPPSTIPKPPQPDRTATYVAGGLIALVVVGFGCVAVAVVGLIAVLTVEKTAEQHFDDGLSSFDSARMDEAATSFQAACDKEHAPACLRLGVMFEQGKHTERDVEQAATLYRTACRLEEPEACNRVGVMYEHGTGLEQNNRKAFKAYSESCKGGYALGCTNVGWMYNGGRGVKKNLARAKKYYSKGCDKGSARGCTNLGVLYERGQGVKADPKRAFALYTRGCKDNDPIACTNVGWMYFNGRGVKKNVERAAHFYQKGCDKGSVKGCNNLGVLYETGDGLEKDPTKAKKLYAQACDRNDYMACNNLGTLHDKDKAFSKANALYTRACQNDYSASCTNLGLNHQNGRGVPADDEQATRFYRQACELGNGAGCTNLGWMYKKGRGVPQKTAKAVALYKEG